VVKVRNKEVQKTPVAVDSTLRRCLSVIDRVSIVRLVCFVFFSTLAASGAPGRAYIGLPDGAVLLEEEPLPVSAPAHRALILWVLSPEGESLKDQALVDENDEIEYTCPDQTRGHFYTAPARVSLVNTESRQVLNTVPVMLAVTDQYDIPFWIKSGFAYEVSGPLKQGSGKPHILALKDFNGDGKALEFAFYVMESCSGPLTMVMGYSERQDRVIVYEFLLKDKSWDKPTEPQSWIYRFSFHKPIAPMHWRYDEWYNSGEREEWDFRYVPDRERFEGTTTVTDSRTNLKKLHKKN
jgi:hypothetical protein